ncbi:MAG: hypothetical protein QY323_05125 [Patescibacteria group bacterium]|nr:MAG: hypothetical protein QY323_05125 [Patescibacteria group bacterium]
MTAPIIPESVRTFMDDVIAHLAALTKDHDLQLAAYMHASADSIVWQHNYNGTFSGHFVSFEVWTDVVHATQGLGLMQHAIAVGRGSHQEWFHPAKQVFFNKDQLLHEARRQIMQLKHSCFLVLAPKRRPHALA